MKKTTQENTGDILLGSRVNFRLPMGFFVNFIGFPLNHWRNHFAPMVSIWVLVVL